MTRDNTPQYRNVSRRSLLRTVGATGVVGSSIPAFAGTGLAQEEGPDTLLMEAQLEDSLIIRTQEERQGGPPDVENRLPEVAETQRGKRQLGQAVQQATGTPVEVEERTVVTEVSAEEEVLEAERAAVASSTRPPQVPRSVNGYLAQVGETTAEETGNRANEVLEVQPEILEEPQPTVVAPDEALNSRFSQRARQAQDRARNVARANVNVEATPDLLVGDPVPVEEPCDVSEELCEEAEETGEEPPAMPPAVNSVQLGGAANTLQDDCTWKRVCTNICVLWWCYPVCKWSCVAQSWVCRTFGWFC